MVFFVYGLVSFAVAFCHIMLISSAEKSSCVGAKRTFARTAAITQHLSADQRPDPISRNFWGFRSKNCATCKNVFATRLRGPVLTSRIQVQVRGGDLFSSDLNDEDQAIGEDVDDDNEQSEQNIRGGNARNSTAFDVEDNVDEVWDTEGEKLETEDPEENINEVVFLQDESKLTEQIGDVDSYDRALADAEALLDHTNVDDENESSAYIDRMDLADAYDDDLGLDTEDFDVQQGVVSAARSQNAPEETPSSSSTIDETSLNENNMENVESPAATVDVVDDETKAILVQELNYRQREIDRMKPEIAALVGKKKLFRPPEGIPEHWNLSNSTTTANQLAEVRRVLLRLSKIVIPAIIVLFVSKGPILQSSKKQRAKAAPLSANVPVATALPVPVLVVDSTQSSPLDELSSSSPQVPEYLPVDSNPHSVKPGTSKQAVVQSEKDLDITWLDKLITKLENKIRALLQWEF
jgi:hypothetical protein